jgi:hypothetical protein
MNVSGFACGQAQGGFAVVDGDKGLDKRPPTLLEPLPQAVQVCGEHGRRREQRGVLFALALAIELLPPL